MSSAASPPHALTFRLRRLGPPSALLAALLRGRKSRRPPPSPLRLHRRLGKDAAARPCLMADAPARPRSGRGFSIRPPCLSENSPPSWPAPCGPDPPYALGSTSRVEGGGRRLTEH